MAGCGSSFANLPEVNIGDLHQTPIGSLQGSAFGGQQPIWNSHVYLMKASTNGYGAASVSLLQAAPNTTADANGNYYVTTNGYGNFNITGDYSCMYNATMPSQSDQLYIVTLGGNATYSGGGASPTGGALNAYLGLMAVLGQCPSDGTFAGHLSFIYINEVSTVATAYALSGFASSSISVGTSNTAAGQVGLANAFANANQLYDIQGTTPNHEARPKTPDGTGTVPYKLINTLANVLAACVNQGSTAAVPTSGPCLTLFNLTGSPDLPSVIMYIAQHPTMGSSSNLSALYALQGSTPQFPDVLTSKPNDFTLGINFASSYLQNPVDVAIDAAGNAWVSSNNGYLSKLSSLGAQTLGSPLNVPGANYIGLDAAASVNVWVTSTVSNTVSQVVTTAGNLLSTILPGLLPQGDFSQPAALAVYGTSYNYVANPGGGSSLFGLLGSSGDVGLIQGSSVTAPVSMYASYLSTTLFNELPSVTQAAVDSNGNVWVSGDGVNCTLLLFCSGANVQRISPSSFSQGGTPGAPIFSTQAGAFSCFIFCSVTETPIGIAIDGLNNGWVAINGSTDKLEKITSSGVIAATLTGGGLNNPQGVAIDGGGNVYVVNGGNNSLSEYAATATTPAFATGATGFTSAGNATNPATLLSSPTKIDIDQAGNVWVVNGGSNGYLTEFIGMARPTLRPLSAAAASGKLAAKP
jgi:hypothetical protein